MSKIKNLLKLSPALRHSGTPFLLGLFAVLALALPARAQTDYYFQGRMLNIDGPRYIAQAAGPTGTNAINVFSGTNDMHGFVGVGTLIISFTNGLQPATTGISNNLLTALAVTLQTAPDATNWTTPTNLSVATMNTFFYTNLAFGSSNLVFSNNIYVPGSISNAVPAVQGFAGSYLAPSPFTNSGAITTNTYGGTYVVGLNMQDSQRYWRLVYQSTNTIGFETNAAWNASAIFLGRRETPGGFVGQY